MKSMNAEKNINAANVIKRSIRRHFENNAIDEMRKTMINAANNHNFGAIYDYHKLKDGDNYPDLRSNMRTITQDLRNELGIINENQQGFVQAFKSKEFYIVHASENNLIDSTKKSLNLFSRATLMERKMTFCDYSGATQKDLSYLGNDRFVSFSLEVGRNPKKCKSRFGHHFYRIRYSGNKFSLMHSSMMLFDQLNPYLYLEGSANRERLFNHFNISAESRKQLEGRTIRRGDSSFSGFDNSINGLLYYILNDISKLCNEHDRKKLLSARSDDEFNLIINGLYRPEVRVPRMAGFLDGEYEYIKHGSSGCCIS
ncbi:RHS repeat-associated core domain-containing protein [Xenorhabdus mauleonii]|uniref:RHS repeat-associated core domain-containing protein n=1 Tax=Xenorhabdus mauleonii TaxID=351675 RepID=A0A1I3PKQ1_9GAMM|nr:hypothetical protein [Xenorhabdus mauleonii]PHM44767.1 RHS repeat-associated core domain-containing protein [Xenorhabdus mauleonii]SFJ22108.1 hypothetical protein SAMN05421680_106180 [Xenorhabdus mauleonii]